MNIRYPALVIIFLAACSCLWLIASALRSGVAAMRSASIHRDKQPFFYWLTVLLYLAAFFLLAYGLVRGAQHRIDFILK